MADKEIDNRTISTIDTVKIRNECRLSKYATKVCIGRRADGLHHW